MSFEAIARARKIGAIGSFETKWLTVPSDSIPDAIAAFRANGYETAGLRVVSQDEATRIAAIERMS